MAEVLRSDSPVDEVVFERSPGRLIAASLIVGGIAAVGGYGILFATFVVVTRTAPAWTLAWLVLGIAVYVSGFAGVSALLATVFRAGRRGDGVAVLARAATWLTA